MIKTCTEEKKSGTVLPGVWSSNLLLTISGLWVLRHAVGLGTALNCTAFRCRRLTLFLRPPWWGQGERHLLAKPWQNVMYLKGVGFLAVLVPVSDFLYGATMTAAPCWSLKVYTFGTSSSTKEISLREINGATLKETLRMCFSSCQFLFDDSHKLFIMGMYFRSVS